MRSSPDGTRPSGLVLQGARASCPFSFDAAACPSATRAGPGLSCALVLLLAGCAGQPHGGRLNAPNPAAKPVNQLSLSSQACGPAALLYAFSAGTDDWQRAYSAVDGESDRQRLAYIIKRYALHPSRHLSNHRRWSRHGGVSSADLADIGNEMAAGRFLPGIRWDSLIATSGGDHGKLLRHAHRRLSRSLIRGLPPILALKRAARRTSDASPSAWRIVEGHYVVVTGMPSRIGRDANGFDLEFMDPHGGRQRTGTLRIPDGAGPALPWLEFVSPDTPVGLRLVRPGEQSLVTAAAAVGRF